MLIRDPIHGDIELTGIQARLLDSAAMQRLRGIRQLGAAYLVYPGCNHTRFEHALGTLAVAQRLLDTLAARGFPVAEERDAVCAAALLHDVACVPYGHFLEDVLGLIPAHDSPARLAPKLEGEIASALGRSLADRVLALLTGGGPAWARAVVAGVVDADMLDYLRRDAFHAGLTHGYDDRIFRYLTVVGGTLAVEVERDGLHRPDAISELVNLLRLRYYLTERVYCHHAKLAAEAMLGKALGMAVAAGYPVTRLHDLVDADLPGELERAGAGSLARDFVRRRLLKRAYVLSARSVPAPQRASLAAYLGDLDRRQQVEAELSGGRAVVAVTCLSPTRMKDPGVVLSNGSLLPGEAPLDISALEAGYENLWRLYVFSSAEHVAEVAEAAAAYFGRDSEYHRPRADPGCKITPVI